MANFVDYNGKDIEESLLVTDTSHGLISKENNSHLEFLYNSRAQFGGTIKTNSMDQKRTIYKYRIYYEGMGGDTVNSKMPYILLLTNNNDIPIFSGVIFSQNGSVISFTPTVVFKNPNNGVDVVAKFLKIEREVCEIQFTANYGDWSSCALIVPGFRVEAFD